ncbi:hypothetical protein [uncultured Kordia sp.]|uniref:hypothetical protein n=1 Tax=uncultured Kordia sp. TaxID=507699 RepID=UPI002617D391|nr:hypothetical protein [uncultured Kordia sp.]
MKRFALNKIKIAQLINAQTIKGKGVDPSGTTVDLQECASDPCPSNLQSCTSGVMPCTNTSIDGHDATNPSVPNTLP